MSDLKIGSLILAIVGALTGLIAAYCWYQSSTIPLPASFGAIISHVPDEAGRIPLDAWTEEVGSKNKEAAIWTMISVILFTLSSVAGAFV